MASKISSDPMRPRRDTILAVALLGVAASVKRIRWEHSIVATAYGDHHLTTSLNAQDKFKIGRAHV